MGRELCAAFFRDPVVLPPAAALGGGPLRRDITLALKAVEQAKASVRAFVEHPFHIVKNIFRHRKVRYRGLAKNGHQLYALFGLANVVIGARTRAAA